MRIIQIISVGLMLYGCLACTSVSNVGKKYKDATLPNQTLGDASQNSINDGAIFQTDSLATAKKDSQPAAKIDGGGSCAACSVNADCWTSDAGAKSCKCKPGYLGDGVTCTNVAAILKGFRLEIPCGTPVSDACVCTSPNSVSVMLNGQANVVYDITLRFRGVIEQKTYSGGTNDGAFWQVGGNPSGVADFNIYLLTISSPSATITQKYYLNRGTSTPRYCFSVDYQKTLQVNGDATFTLSGDTQGGFELKNNDQSGTPIVVPNVSPAPAAFNGQFIQIDVIDVKLH